MKESTVSSEKLNIHKGHRARMKGVYKKHRFDAFEEHEILEFLLFYAIPYMDTNPIAHALISRFGSLRGVFEAKIDDLTSVCGIGQSAAIFLKAYGKLGIASVSRKKGERAKADSPDKIYEYVRSKRIDEDKYVFLIMMDNKREIINEKRFCGIGITSAGFSVKDALTLSVETHASSVCICVKRNAPFAFPSSEEIDTAKELSKIFANAGIVLYDFLIVTDGDFCSVRKEGKI